MHALPAADLRSNVATWAVATHQLPALASWMHDVLPNESYDLHFLGQRLETTYFDSPDFALRKARLARRRYLTLRLRCYEPAEGPEFYALSVKTESEKWRQPISSELADLLLAGAADVAVQLPGHLRARLLELGAEALVPAVTVCCRRYAVEDAADRYTLDVAVQTDTGKALPFHVLEYKSTDAGAEASTRFHRLNLRPVKLSKFLWATQP